MVRNQETDQETDQEMEARPAARQPEGLHPSYLPPETPAPAETAAAPTAPPPALAVPEPTSAPEPAREDGWRHRRVAVSLPEVFRSIKVSESWGFWRKLLAFGGPGLMVAVGYMDPGNWATDLA
ncbi:MAG: hypothetical protein ABI847_14150, partial [Anaerolineales bacterium]